MVGVRSLTVTAPGCDTTCCWHEYTIASVPCLVRHARGHARTREHTHTHTYTRTNARTHARTHTHTHHAPRATRHAPRATRHAPRATRHAPRATRHAPHATRHTPHATRHTPHTSGVARAGPRGHAPPQTFGKCFLCAMNLCCYVL